MAIIFKTKMDIKMATNPINPVSSIFKPTFVQYNNVILQIQLMDGLKKYILKESDTVLFTHLLPDGTGVTYPGYLFVDGDTQFIRYKYRGSEMQYLGVIPVGITISDENNEIISIKRFEVVIEEDITNVYTVPANEQSSLLFTMISDIEQLKNKEQQPNVIPSNGKDGKDGVDGYTPKKGVDYHDGLPGAPGKDGKDGLDGRPGLDGTSGLNGLPGLNGKDGKDGKDAPTNFGGVFEWRLNDSEKSLDLVLLI